LTTLRRNGSTNRGSRFSQDKAGKPESLGSAQQWNPCPKTLVCGRREQQSTERHRKPFQVAHYGPRNQFCKLLTSASSSASLLIPRADAIVRLLVSPIYATKCFNNHCAIVTLGPTQKRCSKYLQQCKKYLPTYQSSPIRLSGQNSYTEKNAIPRRPIYAPFWKDLTRILKTKEAGYMKKVRAQMQMNGQKTTHQTTVLSKSNLNNVEAKVKERGQKN
jgi:hypothetical protein